MSWPPSIPSLAAAALALLLSPLLPGIINRVKAFFAGRRGPPLLQYYFDLIKLSRKGAVYSRTASWVFRAGPVAGLAAAIAAAMLVPLGGAPALVHFDGDFILLAGLLGLLRFVTVSAALDAGSSFEGMGASREVQFAAIAEPALLLSLAALARQSGALSLSEIYPRIGWESWAASGPALALAAAALVIVILAENARIPVDDPGTHLELTMVHEVMVLDHGGPDLAFILYGAALKLWALGALLAGILAPARSGNPWIDVAAGIAGLLALAVIVGIVESSMARLRLVRVPQLLVSAGVFSALALVMVFW